MSSYRKKASVGIKELKDRASEIIAFVQRIGESISITKNGKKLQGSCLYLRMRASV